MRRPCLARWWSTGVPVSDSPRSPNLNAYAECWVRPVQEECLARLVLFGEASLGSEMVLSQILLDRCYKEHFPLSVGEITRPGGTARGGRTRPVEKAV